ncbi:hypothetical protein FACS1894203_4900 [Bacteroidia bacterium]|nr:hypothetical protein FACS1894203_4900 [Bacteroidia bacterium]GHU89383.1 hypothetical protein FACS1894155_06240 [Bacteroidia bacterium]
MENDSPKCIKRSLPDGYVDDRYRKKALIISSQLPVSDWYAVIGNELIAEACLDRIVHKAIRFQLKGESLRKKY